MATVVVVIYTGGRVLVIAFMEVVPEEVVVLKTAEVTAVVFSTDGLVMTVVFIGVSVITIGVDVNGRVIDV